LQSKVCCYVCTSFACNACHALRQAFVKKFGHGKLLVDESIFPLAYATNVNEQVLEVRGRGLSSSSVHTAEQGLAWHSTRLRSVHAVLVG